jgi:hypothetical protein
MEFLTVISVCKSFPPVTFLGELFCPFVNRFKLSIEFAFYDTHLFAILALSTNFTAKIGQNGSRKRKTYFIMFPRIPFYCTSISSLGGSIKKKKVKIVVPLCTGGSKLTFSDTSIFYSRISIKKIIQNF